MQLIFSPVAGIIAMSTSRISEAYIHSDGSLRLYMGSYHIENRVAGCFHLVSLTFIYKAALDHTFPHIQCLVYLLDLLRICTQRQSQCTQMQTMRVYAIPVASCLGSFVVLYLCGIRFLTASAKIIITPAFLWLIILWIGKRMPAPVAHGSQWNTKRIRLRERLKTCTIYCHGKTTITYRERVERIHCRDMWIVTLYHLLSVDGLLSHRAQCKQQANT